MDTDLSYKTEKEKGKKNENHCQYSSFNSSMTAEKNNLREMYLKSYSSEYKNVYIVSVDLKNILNILFEFQIIIFK